MVAERIFRAAHAAQRSKRLGQPLTALRARLGFVCYFQAGERMNDRMDLQALIVAEEKTPRQSKTVFALLNLGIIESLANGLMSAADAPCLFYHADNCLFVRKRLRDKTADEIMSRGVQLPDLFDALPTAEAQREFQRELATMRGLCLKLLEKKPLVA